MSDPFPILFHWNREARAKELALGCPATIPWALIAPHERQAKANHDQTLGRLAERGGLAPAEAVAVLEDRDFHTMSDEAAIAQLNRLVAAAVRTP